MSCDVKKDVQKHEDTVMSHLMDYGYDMDARTLYVDTGIDSESIQNITRAFRKMEQKSSEQITVILNSPGGSVYDGLYLYDLFTTSKCKIITIGYGHIMSMATFLLCAGDERMLSPTATVMVHEISSWIAGELSDLQIEVKESERLAKLLIDIYCKRTKQKKPGYWKRFKKAKYFTPSEAVTIGLADKVLENTK